LERSAQLLDVAGYLQPRSRAAMLIKLRRLLRGLNLTCNDARILGGVLSQVEWKLEQASPSKL
jgi:tRNA C32,U32 (ribose-2'-O)-methylase TrmJ